MTCPPNGRYFRLTYITRVQQLHPDQVTVGRNGNFQWDWDASAAPHPRTLGNLLAPLEGWGNDAPWFARVADCFSVLGYRIDVTKPQGDRITEMTLLKTGEAIDPAKTYQVAGWASVNEDTEGPQIWDVVEAHIAKQGTISLDPNNSVEVVGA